MLEAAGAVVERDETPGDEITQVEGHRYLARLITSELETALDRADSAHPVESATPISGGDTSGCCDLDAHIKRRRAGCIVAGSRP